MFNIRVEDAERAGYIKNRHYKGGTSFPEQFIFRSLLQIFPRTENRVIDSDLDLEFDIFVPELNLRIEYSGSYWHADEGKQYRDQKRREFCKFNKATYVEIIEKCGANKLELQKEGNHLVYTMSVSDNYKGKISRLIEIIENLMYHFNIDDANIDYTRAMYEAFMLSTPYQYNIIRDDENNIVGKKYTEPVYSNFYMNNDNSEKVFKPTGKQLVIKPVMRDSDMLIQDDYEMLNQLMFNGNSLDGLKIKTQEEIDIEGREIELTIAKKQLEKERQSLEEEKKIVDQKKEQVESMYQQLAEKIKTVNKELYKIKNEKSKIECEKIRFENNIQDEYSRKFNELIAEMEQEITERVKDKYSYEIDRLNERINDKIEYTRELREEIENYKIQLSRYKLDRKLRMSQGA